MAAVTAFIVLVLNLERMVDEVQNEREVVASEKRNKMKQTWRVEYAVYKVGVGLKRSRAASCRFFGSSKADHDGDNAANQSCTVGDKSARSVLTPSPKNSEVRAFNDSAVLSLLVFRRMLSELTEARIEANIAPKQRMLNLRKVTIQDSNAAITGRSYCLLAENLANYRQESSATFPSLVFKIT